MSVFNVVKGKAGSALILVLLAAAFFTAISVPLLDMLVHSASTTRERQVQWEYEFFLEAMKLNLNDPILCHRALAGQRFPAQINRQRNIEVNLSYGPTSGPIAEGWQLWEGLRLSRVRIHRSTDRLTQVWLDQPNGARDKFLAEVLFVPENVVWNMIKDDNPAIIPIYVKVRNGIIDGCHGINSYAEICEGVGGAFDALAPDPRYRCNPDTSCFNDGQGMITTPNCRAPYQVMSIGNLEGEARYFCTWCNTNKL